jgi:hypothetical protein
MEKAPDVEEEKLLRLRDKMKSSLSDRSVMVANFDRIAEFSEKLRKKHGSQKLEQCRLYHLIAQSTQKEPAEFFDFEGDDSIERFIDAL